MKSGERNLARYSYSGTQVMTVPVEYFDVNPGKRRFGASPYASWMRFSFGPPMDNLVLGLDRLQEMLR